MDTRVSLERLDVDNYATWSVRMRFTLIARGLWEHVINDGEVTDKAGDQKALALIGLSVMKKKKKSCYIVCLRSSVDLSRHPGGPRQLHNPDTLHDMFSSDGRSTNVHTHSPYKNTTARTHQNIHARTNYMVFSSLSFL